MEKSYKELLKDITTFIFDADGVLTDGSVLVTSEGELLRNMSILDGYALKTACQKGYHVCIISGGTNEGVKARLQNLGVEDIYLGAHDKLDPFKNYLKAKDLSANNVLYMGDDIPDIPALKEVILPTCPKNAVAEVRAICKYVSHKKGGKGCVRDVIEQVLKVRGDWYQSEASE